MRYNVKTPIKRKRKMGNRYNYAEEYKAQAANSAESIPGHETYSSYC